MQQAVDDLRGLGPQRWLLAAAAVAACSGASAAASAASPGGVTPIVALVAVLAVVAAARPFTHAASVAMVTVVAQWLTVADDVTSTWSIVVALGLFVFHGLVALMAVTPGSGVVDPVVLRRWAGRGTPVAAATVATWALALVLERRTIPGHTALTAAGLALVVVATVVLRTRSLGEHEPGSRAR